jgi:hypothetical protein
MKQLEALQLDIDWEDRPGPESQAVPKDRPGPESQAVPKAPPLPLDLLAHEEEIDEAWAPEEPGSTG